jgi:flagellar FliJ protein
MKIRIRMKRFEADEKARNIADLEHVVRALEGMASDLDRQIKAEEARTGVNDPAHLAYSTFAKSASQRRNNLRASAEVLMVELEKVQREDDKALEHPGCAGKSGDARPQAC